MPRVSALGHVGLYVADLEQARDFYTRVLGLQVTHESPERGMVFLSSRPDAEDHELVLIRGREAARSVKLLQQLSFHVASLEELRQFRRVFHGEGVEITSIVTHGVSVSIYIYDPEGNRLEVYYTTPFQTAQPFTKPIDIEQDDEGIMRQVRELVEAKG